MTMLRNTQVLWRTMLRPIRKGWIMSWMSRLMKKFTSKAMRQPSSSWICLRLRGNTIIRNHSWSFRCTRSDLMVCAIGYNRERRVVYFLYIFFISLDIVMYHLYLQGTYHSAWMRCPVVLTIEIYKYNLLIAAWLERLVVITVMVGLTCSSMQCLVSVRPPDINVAKLSVLVFDVHICSLPFLSYCQGYATVLLQIHACSQIAIAWTDPKQSYQVRA
jgi:hypothetical protein